MAPDAQVQGLGHDVEAVFLHGGHIEELASRRMTQVLEMSCIGVGRVAHLEARWWRRSGRMTRAVDSIGFGEKFAKGAGEAAHRHRIDNDDRQLMRARAALTKGCTFSPAGGLEDDARSRR